MYKEYGTGAWYSGSKSMLVLANVMLSLVLDIQNTIKYLQTFEVGKVTMLGIAKRRKKTYERLNISIIISIASGILWFLSPVYSRFNIALTASLKFLASPNSGFVVSLVANLNKSVTLGIIPHRNSMDVSSDKSLAYEARTCTLILIPD